MNFNDILLQIIVVLLIFTGCQDDSCPITSGKRTEAIHYFTESNVLFFHDDIDYELIQDSLNYISVFVGENLQENIEITFINDTIIIRNNNNCAWLRSFDDHPEVKIHYSEMVKVIYKGSGKVITADTMKQTNLWFDVSDGHGSINLTVRLEDKLLIGCPSGSADITINGSVHNFVRIENRSYGFIDAQGLKTEKSKIIHSSGNDIYAPSSEIIEYNINYTGNIYYMDSPKLIDIGSNGTGKIIPF